MSAPADAGVPAGLARQLFHDHRELREAPPRRGPLGDCSIEQILARLPGLAVWPQRRPDQLQCLHGARSVLAWLAPHPGTGWQDRWVGAGCEAGTEWIDALSADDPRDCAREQTRAGLSMLLLARVMAPSYDFLAAYQPYKLYLHVQQVHRPEVFTRIRQAGPRLGLHHSQLENGLRLLAKIVLHTGREVDQLTAEDIFAYRAWSIRAGRRSRCGIHLSWTLLREVVDLGEHVTLRAALRFGQRPTAELVDRYGIRCPTIRQVLIRYLDERRPGLDHGSFRSLVTVLVRNFWVDIERHQPGINTLRLPEEVAQAWKLRMATVTKDGEVGRARKNKLDVLLQVRAFYLDIAEWALEDPVTWAQWAHPSPVRRADLAGMGKHRSQTTAAMHQRVRDRLPHLPLLADTAAQHRTAQAALLHAATATAHGEVFEHDGRRLRRTTFPSYQGRGSPPPPPNVVVEDLGTDQRLDLTRTEDEAFWAWVVIEALRHTGLRIEELLELTQLALVSYTLPDTGEVVPLLQIVPSKGNEERLLLVSPELASALASIISRLRGLGDGTIPQVARYDEHERLTGPPLPHLFQRKVGHRHEVISKRTIQKLLAQTLQRTGLRDAANNPLHYTPHDFRRMFATESVTGGLPVHIAARILGHQNLNTTQAYLAVFTDDLVRTYRSFLDQRRALRPTGEYREPTDAEWREFEQHFALRKLELGTCGRPYGTPCKHEHACIRCPMLRIDPRQRPRLAEIIHN
ncbi:MAG: tyrosine-type recombinase/integrase, partial [Sciscionella sp.]